MRGDKTLKILNSIGDGLIAAGDVLKAFLSSGYGASPGRVGWELRKMERKRAERESEKRAKQNYYNLICKLKREGFILEKVNSGKKFFALTNRGKRKFAFLHKATHKTILPSTSYVKESDSKLTIVSFDIPERERRKRDWLRMVLCNLGFTKIQRSVWIGKVKIPQNFLESLRGLGLIGFVEIFEISKTGTLQHVE